MCAKFTRCAVREVVTIIGDATGAVTAARLVGHDRTCDGHGGAVVDPAAVAGTVPADGRVHDGHVAVVQDPAAAVGGTVLADGRVHDGHVVFVVDPAAAVADTVPADGRVHDGHVAVVVDSTTAAADAIGGTVLAYGRVGDGHGALVDYPAAVGAGISACHSQVLECHRKAGTVGECSAGVGRRVIAI